MIRLRQWLALGCLAVCTSFAADILDSLTVNGITYENVKWGPVNNGKVTIIHNRGVANVKLEDLPPGLQTPFPYTPKPAPEEPKPRPKFRPPPDEFPSKLFSPPPPPPPKTPEQLRLEAEMKEFDVVRASKVMLNGNLIEKTKLTALTGFVRDPLNVDPTSTADPLDTLLELAVKRPDAARVAPQFELRPNLWKATADFIWLKDYNTDIPLGLITRVYGTEAQPIRGRRVFQVGKEPTFDEWKNLRGSSSVPAP